MNLLSALSLPVLLIIVGFNMIIEATTLDWLWRNIAWVGLAALFAGCFLVSLGIGLVALAISVAREHPHVQ